MDHKGNIVAVGLPVWRLGECEECMHLPKKKMKIKYYRDLGGCNTQVWVLGLYKLSWPAYGSYVYVTFYFFKKNFYFYFIIIIIYLFFVLFCFVFYFYFLGGRGKERGKGVVLGRGKWRGYMHTKQKILGEVLLV